MDFFNLLAPHFYLGLGISLLNGILLCYVGYKFMQIIQLSGYKLRGYFYWLKDTRAKFVLRLLILTILSTACLIVTNIVFKDFTEYFSYIGLVFYFAFALVFNYFMHNAPQKTPLKLTNRMNRSIGLLFFINAAITFGFIALSSLFVDFFRLGAVALTPLLLPFTVPFVHWVMQPVEKAINTKFVRQAKKKLSAMPELIKIGITGSLGKTSTKNFLATILAEQYNVCATPHSYNTPMGITKSIIQYLSPYHQVFICEMGARNVGDIKELCGIVNPGLGIITSIIPQHMATFKTLENVERAKGELAAAMPEDGFMVFNGDNIGSMNIFAKTKCAKQFSSLANKKSACFASDIKTSINGTSFKLHINKDVLECKTRLFGEHNVSNILMCVLVAKKLGLSNEQIINGIDRIVPVEHRLELIRGERGIIILDDTYNASIEGSERALQVLKNIEGKRKIVVTPGLVELGNMERLENYNLGKKIAGVADKVILVNKTNFLSMKQGLLDAGFKEENIKIADTLTQAREMLPEILEDGAVVLFENDLPDNYT